MAASGPILENLGKAGGHMWEAGKAGGTHLHSYLTGVSKTIGEGGISGVAKKYPLMTGVAGITAAYVAASAFMNWTARSRSEEYGPYRGR